MIASEWKPAGHVENGVVLFAKPTSASHQLVATMHAAGVVLQPKRLFIQLQTVGS